MGCLGIFHWLVVGAKADSLIKRKWWLQGLGGGGVKHPPKRDQRVYP